MVEIMAQFKHTMQPVFVYVGSIFTILTTWFDDWIVTGIEDGLAILVALATLIYTILLIIEKSKNIKDQDDG